MAKHIRKLVPKDHPVKPIRWGSERYKAALARGDLAQCGNCFRYWDDGKVTSMTPTPSGRCPFEYYHND